MAKAGKGKERTGGIGRREFIQMGAVAGAVSALDARGLLAETRPAGAVSIDLHTHWVPRGYARAYSKLRKLPGGSDNPLNYDLEKRVAWMDSHGVRMHTLTLDGGMPWQWIDAEHGAELARIINDEAVETHRKYPQRFTAGIELPAMDPDRCMKELERVAGRPGLRAVHLPNSMAGRDYVFEPAYAPLLARTEQLNLPLIFHPLDGEANFYGGMQRLGDPLSQRALLNNTLGFPFESATTAAKFITTGTLDKYPRLKVVLPHTGGAFPYVAGRVGYGMERVGFKLPHPFAEYIRRFHYDCLTYDLKTLRFLVNRVGADRVVIGTDTYARMAVEYPNKMVEQLHLPAAERDHILFGNATQVLGL